MPRISGTACSSSTGLSSDGMSVKVINCEFGFTPSLQILYGKDENGGDENKGKNYSGEQA